MSCIHFHVPCILCYLRQYFSSYKSGYIHHAPVLNLFPWTQPSTGAPGCHYPPPSCPHLASRGCWPSRSHIISHWHDNPPHRSFVSPLLVVYICTCPYCVSQLSHCCCYWGIPGSQCLPYPCSDSLLSCLVTPSSSPFQPIWSFVFWLFMSHSY